MSNTKMFFVIFTTAMCLFLVNSSSDMYHAKPQGFLQKESYFQFNATKQRVPMTSNDTGFFMNYIYRPVELTVMTVSAFTLIPQQRVVCLTLAVASHGLLLPQELTAKEQVITTAFWVLVDSLETPTVAEYTGQVKEFGDMMARIVVLPFRVLGRMASLFVQCTWRMYCCLARWSYNIMGDCLALVINTVLFVHRCCWPVAVEISRYCILPLFVQADQEAGLASYIIHGINTVLHVLYFMVKLVVLDPINALVYYSWSDMTCNYLINYGIESTVEVLSFILVDHWKLTSVGCLGFLWLCSFLNLIINGKGKKEQPRKLRVLRKRRP